MSRLSRQQEEVPDQIITVYVISDDSINGQQISQTITISINATVLDLMRAICAKICGGSESTPVFNLTFLQTQHNKEITAHPGTRYYKQYMNMRLYQWGFNENNSTVKLKKTSPLDAGNEPPDIPKRIQSNIRLNF